jgi:hypothetical protein
MSDLLTPDERAAIERVRLACGPSTSSLLLRALVATRVDLKFARMPGPNEDRMRAALRRGYDESGWCALCETHGDLACPVCGEGQDGR